MFRFGYWWMEREQKCIGSERKERGKTVTEKAEGRGGKMR
jgi:hypothetical protein